MTKVEGMGELRKLTKAGEAAMDKAAAEVRAMLGHHHNEIVRAYAAIGILGVVLDEINEGVSREVARENLLEALKRLDGPSVLN